MPVKIQCPNPACGKAGSVADELLGSAVRCPHCKTKFTVPTTMEQTPTAEESTNRKTAGTETVSVAGPTTWGGPGPSAAEMPAEIGRFQVRAVLGSGAFGTVYRAFDPQLDREAAIKVPRAGTLDSPLRVQRFLREAKTAAKLRHPNIVPVYEAGQDGDLYFIASAFIEGQNLAQLAETGPMNFQRAVSIVRALAEALAYAHERGVVHRDVKPENIMIDDAGAPLLMDFGLAYQNQEAAAKLTQQGTLLGTPAYMAPEQVKGRAGEPMPASDQYSLGVILFELLSGKRPFSGPSEVVLFNTVNTPPSSPRSLKPSIPAELERICLRALSKLPQERFATCQQLADNLGRWLAVGNFSSLVAGAHDHATQADEVGTVVRHAPSTLMQRAPRVSPQPIRQDVTGIGDRDLLRLAGPLGIGSLLVLLLAFSFSWTWFSPTLADGRTVNITGLGTVSGASLRGDVYVPQLSFARPGQIHLGLSIAISILGVIGYVVASTSAKIQGGLAARALFGIVLATAAWGTLNFVWMAGFIWTTFSSYTLPGLGLWAGAALALGVSVLFVTMALRWRHLVWLVISQEIAGLIGWCELSLEPEVKPVQYFLLFAIYLAMNGAFLFTSFLYLVHFSSDAEERTTGLWVLALQVLLAGIGILLLPWRFAELLCILLMQMYLAVRYPLQALVSQDNHRSPTGGDFGGLFAAEVLACLVFWIFWPAAAPPSMSLNGVWVVTQMQVAGEEVADFKGAQWIIQGENLTSQGEAGGSIRTNPTATPKTLELIQRAGTALPGIYELDGDLLKICFGTEGGSRPVELSSTRSNRQTLLIMRRQPR